MYSIVYMELDFGTRWSAIDSLDQIAAKKSKKEEFSLFNAWAYAREQTAESSDSLLINAFKNVTVDYLREKIGTKKFNCTCTVTLDLKKSALRNLRNDHTAQWRHLKQQMRAHMGTYNYRFYIIPEYQKRNGIVHAHGIICFNSPTYDDYCYDRSRWVKKMSIKCGRMIQWTRINDLYHPYMPTETNKVVRRKQTFAKWINDYCHKDTTRLKLGHCNMME